MKDLYGGETLLAASWLLAEDQCPSVSQLRTNAWTILKKEMETSLQSTQL